MNDISTYSIVLELKHRLESFLYDGEQDSMLEDSDIDLAENVYFLLEEFALQYKETILERVKDEDELWNETKGGAL